MIFFCVYSFDFFESNFIKFCSFNIYEYMYSNVSKSQTRVEMKMFSHVFFVWSEIANTVLSGNKDSFSNNFEELEIMFKSIT